MTSSYSVPPPPAKEAIRLCLAQLLDDCLHADMPVPALHIRLAMMEIEQAETKDNEKKETLATTK